MTCRINQAPHPWPSFNQPSRYRPDRRFPCYAYLPGMGMPHPVRHPHGHSFAVANTEAGLPDRYDTDAFLWGIDLFNFHYYWEAHEAWEPLWQAETPRSPRRLFLKALILLAAAGVKAREGKPAPYRRHLMRAAALLERLEERDVALLTSLSPRELAVLVRQRCQWADRSSHRSGLGLVLQPHPSIQTSC